MHREFVHSQLIQCCVSAGPTLRLIIPMEHFFSCTSWNVSTRLDKQDILMLYHHVKWALIGSKRHEGILVNGKIRAAKCTEAAWWWKWGNKTAHVGCHTLLQIQIFFILHQGRITAYMPLRYIGIIPFWFMLCYFPTYVGKMLIFVFTLLHVRVLR